MRSPPPPAYRHLGFPSAPPHALVHSSSGPERCRERGCYWPSRDGYQSGRHMQYSQTSFLLYSDREADGAARTRLSEKSFPRAFARMMLEQRIRHIPSLPHRPTSYRGSSMWHLRYPFICADEFCRLELLYVEQLPSAPLGCGGSHQPLSWTL